MIDIKKLEEELKKMNAIIEKQLEEALEKFKNEMEELAKSISKPRR